MRTRLISTSIKHRRMARKISTTVRTREFLPVASRLCHEDGHMVLRRMTPRVSIKRCLVVPDRCRYQHVQERQGLRHTTPKENSSILDLLERYQRRATAIVDYAVRTEHFVLALHAHFDDVLVAIVSGRRELTRLHRAGEIDDETLHELERDLDLEELRAISANAWGLLRISGQCRATAAARVAT